MDTNFIPFDAGSDEQPETAVAEPNSDTVQQPASEEALNGSTPAPLPGNAVESETTPSAMWAQMQAEIAGMRAALAEEQQARQALQQQVVQAEHNIRSATVAPTPAALAIPDDWTGEPVLFKSQTAAKLALAQPPTIQVLMADDGTTERITRHQTSVVFHNFEYVCKSPQTYAFLMNHPSYATGFIKVPQAVTARTANLPAHVEAPNAQQLRGVPVVNAAYDQVRTPAELMRMAWMDPDFLMEIGMPAPGIDVSSAQYVQKVTDWFQTRKGVTFPNLNVKPVAAVA